MARPGGEAILGSFDIFVYFISQLQRLRPLGYCAPLKLKLFDPLCFCKDYGLVCERYRKNGIRSDVAAPTLLKLFL